MGHRKSIKTSFALQIIFNLRNDLWTQMIFFHLKIYYISFTIKQNFKDTIPAHNIADLVSPDLVFLAYCKIPSIHQN